MALSLAECSSETPDTGVNAAGDNIVTERPFEPTLNGKWIGNGISYGAYRDGEAPGEALTSKEHILEDLRILAQRWNLIRLYGSDEQARNILEVIEEHDLPIRGALYTPPVTPRELFSF